MGQQDEAPEGREDRPGGGPGRRPVKGAFDGTGLLSEEEVALLPVGAPHGRLGFAVMFAFAKQHHRFPDDNDALDAMVSTVAEPLCLDPAGFQRYALDGGSRTAARHRARIRELLGLRPAGEADLVALHALLVDELRSGLAEQELPQRVASHSRTHQLEPPTEGVLERVVRSSRRAFLDRLQRKLCIGP